VVHEKSYLNSMMVLFDMDTIFLGMKLLCVMGLFTVTVCNFLNFKICIQDVHKTENIRLYIMQIFMTYTAMTLVWSVSRYMNTELPILIKFQWAVLVFKKRIYQ